nr:RNA-directed DNA polymerase, eukaryota [Tanacetum cinerariifolium]
MKIAKKVSHYYDLANKLKEELLEIDAEIDNGNGNADIVARRLVIINELQCISKSHIAEIAQKIKIRWCVEGDENSKFLHGMLNKKRSQSNLQGVLIDGKWTDEPVKLKANSFTILVTDLENHLMIGWRLI